MDQIIKDALESLLGRFPEVNGWLIVILPIAMGILRGLATLLEAIADKTQTNLDNKALKLINKILKILAIFISWFGIGNKTVKR